MGRRSRADGARTRERILDAALPLFAEHGYAGASIRAIARAADVNVATLAYHFDDKDGLYLTVVQRLHEDLLADFPSVQVGSSPSATVESIVRAGYAFVFAHRQHIRLLMRNVLDEGAHRDVVMERWTDPLMQRAEALIAAFRPEWSAPERRLLVVTMMHTAARIAVEDPVQHARLVGVGVDEVEAHTIRWLVRLAQRELGLPHEPRDDG